MCAQRTLDGFVIYIAPLPTERHHITCFAICLSSFCPAQEKLQVNIIPLFIVADKALQICQFHLDRGLCGSRTEDEAAEVSDNRVHFFDVLTLRVCADCTALACCTPPVSTRAHARTYTMLRMSCPLFSAALCIDANSLCQGLVRVSNFKRLGESG